MIRYFQGDNESGEQIPSMESNGCPPKQNINAEELTICNFNPTCLVDKVNLFNISKCFVTVK